MSMREARSSLPIIVGGCHRSGTTLVRRILNAHPHIYCGPEVKFFRDWFADYADDPYADLRYFATMKTMLNEDDAFAIAGRGFIELHETAARRDGKFRWADKSPENVLYLNAWNELLNDEWLFVHVIRNPLDTIASMRDADFRRSLPTDLDGKIDWYLRLNEAGLAFGARHPDRYLVLNYESLVWKPHDTVRAMMEWLGEAYDPEQLKFDDKSTPRALEDFASFRHDTIHDRSVGRGEENFTEEEARHVRERTGHLWERLSPGVAL